MQTGRRLLTILVGLVLVGWFWYFLSPKVPQVPINLSKPMTLVSAEWGPLALEAGISARVEGLPKQLRIMKERPTGSDQVFTIVCGEGLDRTELLLSRTWIGNEKWTMGGPQVEPVYRAMTSVLYTPENLARAIEAADAVTVIPQDVPAHECDLLADSRGLLARAIAMLGIAPRGETIEHEVATFPFYLVQVRYNSVHLQLEWCGRLVTVSELQDGASVAVANLWDGTGAVQAALCCVSPVTPPQELEQPLRLFACNRVTTSGGPLTQRFDSDLAHTLAVIRCLIQARQAGPTSLAPPGEKPVTMDFSCDLAPSPIFRVLLFPDGYALENRYYQLQGIQLRVLTTINAG